MTRTASAVFAVALVALVWALLHLAWYPHGQITDYGVYQDYGDRIVHEHAVPYRDVRLEYPPAALPMFVIPASLERIGFRGVFQGLMIVCHLGVVLAVLQLAGRRAAAFAAVAPVLLGSVVLSRFDLWPAALAVLAIAALVRGSPASPILLATAFAAKLWPAVLVPLALIWLWRREGRGRALRWLAATLAVSAAWFLPFVVLSPAGVGHSFDRQLARPLQIESLGSSALLAVHYVFRTPLHMVGSYGSQNVAGAGVNAIAILTTLAEIAVLLFVYVRFSRGEPDVPSLLTACAAAVTTLVILGKVFSPQFAIWLIAFVPLVRRASAWALLAIGLVLTQVYFPRRYWELVDFHSNEAGILLARNLVLVALLALLVYYVSQGSTAASSAASSSEVSARNGARTSG